MRLFFRPQSAFIALLSLTVLLVGLPQTFAQDTNACPTDLPPRLTSNSWAKVTSGDPNNLRAEPSRSSELVGQIPAGDIFQVLAEPQCNGGYTWWQIDYRGTTAWTAEGLNGAYWLEPLGAIPAPVDDDPIGCQKPPEVYDQIIVGYGVLNLRTVAMLDHAQEIYVANGGILNFRDGVMQGSYNPGGVSASFGTHDGGGAVDIAVRDLRSGDVMRDQIPLMIEALRTAGFAAWLRDFDELYVGSPIHIHAVAIGDAELSEAARGQIDGVFGYLLGFNGLPQDSGIPLLDTSGDMVICSWMVEMGFDDMRESAAAG